MHMAGTKGKSKAQVRAEDRIATLTTSSRRNGTASKRSDHGVPDIYQEMLSEAEQSHLNEEDSRPAKKRKLDDSLNHNHAIQGDSEDVIHPRQTVVDSGESDDEDMDWEEVGFENVQSAAPSATKPNQAADLITDIVVDITPQKTPKKPVTAKRKPVTSAERLMRLAVHETHLLFLIFHLHVRNAWCNLDLVQSKLKSFLPLEVVGLLYPREDWTQYSRSEQFTKGLNTAIELWTARFKLTESGMRASHWVDSADDITQQITNITEEIDHVDKKQFIKAATTLKGSQDLGNQLFCALLRSVGLEVRLVCSLQPLPFGTAGVKVATPLKTKPTIYADARSDGGIGAEETAGSASETSQNPGRRRRRIGQPNFAMATPTKPPPKSRQTAKAKPKRVTKLEYPIFWVEVFNSAYQRWVPVDAIVTGTINKSSKLEPPASYAMNTMNYVVAFDDRGHAKDVTRRYAKAYNAKTRKLRVESTETGDRWWRKALRPFKAPVHRDRDQIEETDLAKKEAQEGLPNNVQDFKGHPVYALERHLKRHEVIHPKRAVGKINATRGANGSIENVYRRSDVQLVRSADKWYRVGREIKAGEQPLKHVPARRSAKTHEDSDDEAPMTGMYGFSQTKLYVPPPVIGGRITKNAFGNLDVYVPSMVPPGAVHIHHTMAAKAAKILGIDFADAVTGFKFKGRIGEAVKSGVVVASEYRDAMHAIIEGFHDAAQAEEEAKRSAESLRLWRRFLTGMRIGVRLGMYTNSSDGTTDGEKVKSVRKTLDEAEDKEDKVVEAGGFILDTAENTVPTASRFSHVAQPRSLLSQAQNEADADAYNDAEDEQENIEETAPRLRRQRNVTFAESDPEDDSDSADEFVPESVRAPPSRRTRGAAKFSQPEALSDSSTRRPTRRSTRRSSPDPAVLKVADTATEDFGGGFIPEGVGDDPIFETRPQHMDNHVEGESSGSVPDEDAVYNNKDVDEGMGGGFFPDDEAADAALTGLAPQPHIEDHADRVHQHITDDDDDDDAIPNMRDPLSHETLDIYGLQGGGFIPDDEETEEKIPQRDGDDEAERGDIELDTHEAGERTEEGDGEDEDDDRGSLLSHDPEDEDAEPEWLNSD